MQQFRKWYCYFPLCSNWFITIGLQAIKKSEYFTLLKVLEQKYSSLHNIFLEVAPQNPFLIKPVNQSDIKQLRWGWIKPWRRLFKVLASFKSLRSLVYFDQVHTTGFFLLISLLQIPTARALASGTPLHVETHKIFTQHCPLLTDLISTFPNKVCLYCIILIFLFSCRLFLYMPNACCYKLLIFVKNHLLIVFVQLYLNKRFHMKILH